MRVNNLYLLLICLCAAACGETKKEEPVDYRTMKEELMKGNKILYQEEMQTIESFVKRRNWKMNVSGTGIYYAVYKTVDTTQPTIKEGQVARVNFVVYVLGDSLSACYTSDGEPENFLVGMDNVESGLHEGIMYMRKGEKAKIILPSHRAFGLVGDQDLIPPRSTIMYDIELIDIIDTDQSKIIDKNNADRKKREAEALKEKAEKP